MTEPASDALAHWNYPPDLWRDFVDYESRVYRKSVRSALHFIYGTIIGAVVLIVLLSVIPFLVTRKWNSSIWGPAFGISFIAFIFLVVGLIVWLMRRAVMASLRSKTGEAIIGLNEIAINGIGFKWDFGESGWRYLGGGRKTVNVDSLKRIELLELRFVACIPTFRSSPTWDFGEKRVPIEPGKEREADRVLKLLGDELASADDKWKLENASLGHDFAAQICRKCSAPIHEVVMRPWKCTS